MKQNITAVFDIGKTNKKLLLFDEGYRIIYENLEHWDEIADEDGFACDDLQKLTRWVKSSWQQIRNNPNFEITAVNVAAYGASFVHLDAQNRPVTPLYSYLKPIPHSVEDPVEDQFYEKYGPLKDMALATCSPKMGMLNSGFQLYWLKHTKPRVFQNIQTSLHLPQYIAFLLSNQQASDYTSVGCHTALWDFGTKKYHRWVTDEQIDQKLAPFSNSVYTKIGTVNYGVGLHDSSAVVMAYLRQCPEKFMIVSTGTWCIVMNPFNDSPLTAEALERDVLTYLSAEGKPIKAARLFLGREHDHQVAQMAKHFNVTTAYFRGIKYGPKTMASVLESPSPTRFSCMEGTGPFPKIKNKTASISHSSPEMAYHQLMYDLVGLLAISVGLVDGNDAETIYVDGGFAKNELFVRLLANMLPQKKVVVSEVAQATALGAAMWVNQSLHLASDWSFKIIEKD